MGSRSSAPADRSYQGEMLQTVRAQGQAAPEILSLRRQFDPQFTNLNLDNFRQSLLGQLGIAQEAAPQLNRQDAALMQEAIGLDPLAAGLQRMGLEDLALGGSISPQEQQAAQEAVRSQFARRGQLGSNSQLLNEVLNVGSIANARRQQRLANVSGIQSQLSGSGALSRGMLSGLVNPQVAAAMSGQTFINPESDYANQVYSTNYNAAQANAISRRNNRAGLLGGVLRGATGIGTALATPAPVYMFGGGR